MLQHGCSWSGDHHTSVKQTTVRKKNKIGDIKHVKKDTAIYHVCCYGFSQGWENRSLYDKCLKRASQLSCFWYLSNFIWQYLERYRTYHGVLDYILLLIFLPVFAFIGAPLPLNRASKKYVRDIHAFQFHSQSKIWIYSFIIKKNTL